MSDSSQKSNVSLFLLQQILIKKVQLRNFTLLLELYLYSILYIEQKILTRTFSITHFPVTLMTYLHYIMQSKMIFIYTLDSYRRGQKEVLRTLCKVIKQAFVHFKIFKSRRTSSKTLH